MLQIRASLSRGVVTKGCSNALFLKLDILERIFTEFTTNNNPKCVRFDEKITMATASWLFTRVPSCGKNVCYTDKCNSSGSSNPTVRPHLGAIGSCPFQ